MVEPVETHVGPAALVRGVAWGADGPALSFITDDGAARLPLSEGFWLRFRVESGAGIPARYCLGYSTVQGPVDSEHFACPAKSAAERGYQCGSCFARDDFRFMHDFHRSGIAPAGLRAYLAQEHWLYVATFADGITKVGTASARSKWSRLAEQGAVAARYVAHARDGRVVRLLEDLVTADAGLTQFVRGSTKFAALLSPRPAASVDATNAAAAVRVRDVLAAVTLDGFDVVDEQWQPHAFAAAVPGTSQRIAYPQPLDSGEHGLLIDAMLGGYALVTIDDSDVTFLADLSALKGHIIYCGNFVTDVPALQESLF